MEYKIGDTANGHTLTEWGWVPTTEAAPQPVAKKKRSRKKIALVGGAALLVIAAANSGSGESVSTADPVSASVQQDEKPKAEKPKYTKSQANAIRQAESYLDTMPFSKSGLVKQLKYEGYSEADATLAVKVIDVDWNEQAVRQAESYLDTMPFSRSGLIQQLKYEGYSDSQAKHGVDAVGL